MHYVNILMFCVGWLVFLLGQMQNSVRSSSNGLAVGWSGMNKWLQFQYINIITRAFVTAVLYPALIQSALTKMNAPMQAAGFGVQAWGLAGLAGYSANTLLNQLAGLIPALRIEIPQLAPPPSDPPKTS